MSMADGKSVGNKGGSSFGGRLQRNMQNLSLAKRLWKTNLIAGSTAL